MNEDGDALAPPEPSIRSVSRIMPPLEVVNFSMVICGWLSGLRLLVAAFSHPRFCNLKEVKIIVLASYSNTCMNPAILNDYARKVERNLKAAGRSPEIHVSIEMDRRFEMSYVPARIFYNRPRR